MNISEIKYLIKSYGIGPVRAMYNFYGFDEMERRLDAWKEISMAIKITDYNPEDFYDTFEFRDYMHL